MTQIDNSTDTATPITLPRKQLFDLPEGIIYLDGNSLGPLVKGVDARVRAVILDDWREQLIRAWNTAGWMEQSVKVGNLIAPIIGAASGSVVMGDTLSIKLFQALCAGLTMRPERKVILSDSGNFPSDLYIAQGLVNLKNAGYVLHIVAAEEVADCLRRQSDEIAVVMLTEVDYRSGRLHDMQEITALAHAGGAVTIWDLAHSAGALPISLAATGAEFAVGCTYKYLNGGPGAPAFIYVRPDLTETVEPALSGWLGHAEPFAFETTYRPARSIERMRVGTPAVIQMTALEEALKVWDGVDLAEIRRASIALSTLFIAEVTRRCPQLVLASPADPAHRGSQVSFAFEQGYAFMQALIDHGVIGDFRAPNLMRFGITPLYLDRHDILQAVETIETIWANKLWQQQRYQTAQKVT